MNPIERAHATADKVIAANKALEASSRPPQKSLGAHLAGMKSGEVLKGQLGGKNFAVSYDAEDSYGDNGQKVRGATIGRYHINHETGGQKTLPHGPQANTEAARKRGANPNAKALTAHAAAEHLTRMSTPSAADVFNDRRFR